jgi:hypothetical protein
MGDFINDVARWTNDHIGDPVASAARSVGDAAVTTGETVVDAVKHAPENIGGPVSDAINDAYDGAVDLITGDKPPELKNY